MTLREAISLLKAAGIDDPSRDARIIFSEIGGIPSEKLPFSGDVSIDLPELVSAVERRISHEPLQYILGKWWFRKCEFEVSPDCLIPRQETEMLVDIANGAIPYGGRMLDLCTGSGCVVLSAMYERPDITAAALDISSPALRIAEKNREKLGISSDRLHLICADATCGIPAELCGAEFDVITANPPYISESDMAGLAPELSFEPEIALTDGGSGLSVISAIIMNFPQIMKKDGVMAIEIGSGQGKSVAGLAKSADLHVEILTDLSGNDRVAVCRKKFL